MHGAHEWEKFLPWVKDPQDIPVFLDYPFELAIWNCKDQDEPIQNASCALASASGPVIIEVLQRFDPTGPFRSQYLLRVP